MLLKRSTVVFVTVLSVLGLFTFVGIHAQDTTGDETIELETSSPSVTSSVNTEVDRGSRADRLAEIKERRQTVVDAARERMIIRKCSAAQNRIQTHAGNVAAGQERRDEVYGSIAGKLFGLITRLDGLGVDTTEVTRQVTMYNEKLTSFGSNVDDYEIVLGDLAGMDCAADAVAFQATLEEARSLGTSLKDEATLLHSYLKEDVKSAFQALITQLQTETEEEA